MAKKKTSKSSSKKEVPVMTRGKCDHKNMGCSGGNAFYFVGFVGALVYYISTATGFWIGVWGVIKALLWPAFLVFELLKYLHM